MKLAFALLLIGTTLGSVPAAFAAGQGLTPSPAAGPYPGAESGAALILIDSDEDDDDEGSWFRSQSDDDDHDGDDDDCEEEGEDDDDCKTGAVGNAAKAGTVAPPKNGLFTDGTAPVVTLN